MVLGVVLGKKFRNLLGGHFGWQNGSILLCLWLYQQAREGSTAGFLGFLDLRPKNVSCTRLAVTNHGLTSGTTNRSNPTVFVRSPIFPLNSCYPLGLKLCISRKAIELHTNLPLPVGRGVAQCSDTFATLRFYDKVQLRATWTATLMKTFIYGGSLYHRDSCCNIYCVQQATKITTS